MLLMVTNLSQSVLFLLCRSNFTTVKICVTGACQTFYPFIDTFNGLESPQNKLSHMVSLLETGILLRDFIFLTFLPRLLNKHRLKANFTILYTSVLVGDMENEHEDININFAGGTTVQTGVIENLSRLSDRSESSIQDMCST